ncbi:hypothetical protein PG994_002931 [Apiospora phragmitis]|uniref:Copper homeostasis protein cutC homolog n=1 Tax=Apiospora phragmitis TaxID=2905665 RepID=A0ABR1W6K9_9PEZI
MPANLEVPIFGPASALPAIAAGAARIELNAAGSYLAGGLTPTVEDVAHLRDAQVPVRVMIRPRGPPMGQEEEGQRDFLYSDAEIDGMVRSIEELKASGAMQTEGGGGGGSRVVLQVETAQRLVAASRPYKTVFHRAFDDIVGCDNVGGGAAADDDGTSGTVTEWENALASLVQMGVDGILTSGGPGNAAQNIATLRKIMAKAGDSIEIIAGGGVRSGNVGELCSKIDLGRGGRGSDGKEPWVHSSCLTGGDDEVDATEVRKILGELNSK